MRFAQTDDTLTLYFEGEVNSVNAEDVEKDIIETLKHKSFKLLSLDFAKLIYVSSAGLRVILKLKQQYKDVAIEEASSAVYDVLAMTGFVNIMTVHKAMVTIDVTGAEIVGDGFFSTVYRIDKDTIVKVFNRVTDANQIERELSLSKQAFILGIPTAISYDIVKVDTRLGVRFEMLDCDSLKNLYVKEPNRYDELTEKYVHLLKTINGTEALDPSLPSIRAFYFRKLELVKDVIGADAYQKLFKLLSDMDDPHTFVHGDCHFKNIMVQKGELILIDMDTLSYGSPVFELAAIYAPYIAFEEDDPGNNERFLEVTSEFSKKLYTDLIRGYLGKQDIEKELEKIRVVAYLHMVWWTISNTPDNTARLEGNKKRLLELLERVHDLKVLHG